jgi:hypothetical protein
MNTAFSAVSPMDTSGSGSLKSTGSVTLIDQKFNDRSWHRPCKNSNGQINLALLREMQV